MAHAVVLAQSEPNIPAPGVSLLQGLTGLPATNQVHASVGAKFNTLQPTVDQLGFLTVAITNSVPKADGGLVLVNSFNNASQKAYTVSGSYVPVSNPQNLGPAMGSVDTNLALNSIGQDPGQS